MITTCVYVQVKNEFINDFIQAMEINHKASIQEKGNFRFDVLQDTIDPSKFMIYEAYENEDAALAHKETDHYKIWRDKVTDWMAIPRQGIKYKILFPEKK